MTTATYLALNAIMSTRQMATATQHRLRAALAVALGAAVALNAALRAAPNAKATDPNHIDESLPPAPGSLIAAEAVPKLLRVKHEPLSAPFKRSAWRKARRRFSEL